MTAHPEVLSCPADETLAAFIDGQLTGPERAAVIEHLAECGECRSLVMDAAEFQAADEANVVRPRFGRRRWPAVLAAASVAAALLVVFGPQLRERFTPGVDDLVAEFEGSKKRRIEGRLSGGFPHRDYDGPKRGPGDDESVLGDNPGLTAQALEIQQKNADDLHAVGVAHLMLPERHEEIPLALPLLRKALAEAEGKERTAVANDLAVALIAWGTLRSDEPLLQEALQIVEQELRTERTPELLWNRALALRNLREHEKAKAAWQEYLQVDPNSAWAQEVRDRYLRDPGY